MNYPQNGSEFGELLQTYAVKPFQNENGQWMLRTLSPGLTGEFNLSMGIQGAGSTVL